MNIMSYSCRVHHWWTEQISLFIGILPSDDDGVFNVIFRQFRVAKIDTINHVITSRKVYALHNDPRQKV